MAEYEWMKQVHDMVGRKTGAAYAWDRINEAMIRQWCEVMGVDNPLYTDPEYARQSEYGAIVAPPAMLQAWCLAGFRDEFPEGTSQDNPFEALTIMEAHGYPSVVAVNSEMTFDRYVRVGERLYYTTMFDSVSEEKTTGLGTGFFVTVIMYFYSQSEAGEDEKVGELLFRVFKFKAPEQAGSSDKAGQDSSEDSQQTIKRTPPGISDDTRFFWDGLKEGKLLIQHCKSCDKLQHPPGPVCSNCQSFDLDSVESTGKGSLYSFVVMHYPEVPPFEYPNPIGLVELDEGTRIIAGLVECDHIEIGQPLELVINTFDGDLTLPQFRPANS